MPDIIIFGTGGHAKVVYDIVLKQGTYHPRYFAGLDQNLKNFINVEYVHQENIKDLSVEKGIIAIGDNWTRSQVKKLILKIKPNFEFVTAVHPSAAIGQSVTLGPGTVVMAQAAINSDSSIGEHVIVNTHSSIDHDSLIGNFASVAPGVILGGGVKVGDFSAVSLGANVLHGVSIGAHTIVGAGSLVLKTIDDNCVAYGSPCKVIRKREHGAKYL